MMKHAYLLVFTYTYNGNYCKTNIAIFHDKENAHAAINQAAHEFKEIDEITWDTTVMSYKKPTDEELSEHAPLLKMLNFQDFDKEIIDLYVEEIRLVD